MDVAAGGIVRVLAILAALALPACPRGTHPEFRLIDAAHSVLVCMMDDKEPP